MNDENSEKKSIYDYSNTNLYIGFLNSNHESKFLLFRFLRFIKKGL